MNVRSASPSSTWVTRAAAEEQRAARFHRERDRRRLRLMAAWLGLAGLSVTLVLGVVGVRVQQVRLSYRLDHLRATQVALEDQRMRLLVELASLRSLARIEEKARTELGMVAPARDQIRLAREFVAGSEALAAGPGHVTAQQPPTTLGQTR